jgi:hypothetical protein
MRTWHRTALVGLFAGVGYSLARGAFAHSGPVVGFGGGFDRLVLQTFLQAALLLAFVPGSVLVASTTLDPPTDTAVARATLAAGVGTLVAVTLADPTLTVVRDGVDAATAFQPRLLASYLVNGVGPGVHSAVAALAGTLVADRNA